MRVTRDQRGYETTYLLHSPRPGERPRILYWYRTAPGVRVGRRALDEDAIRTIEEQHPQIDFDWPALLEEAESIEPEAEKRPERPRRRPRPETAAAPSIAAEAAPGADMRRVPAPAVSEAQGQASTRQEEGEPSTPLVRPPTPHPPSATRNPLLDQLVGREIASRLRARYAEVALRIAALPPSHGQAAWQARADALDPDRWSSPEAILHGIQHADRGFDELKRELQTGS